MEIEVTEEDLYLSMANIWLSTLGLEMHRTDQAIPLKHEGEQFATGCLHILGEWEGALIIDCSSALAREAAGRMLGMEPAEVPDQDLQDAVGELTNIVAGNIKSDFPLKCRLSFPVVTEGSDYTIRVPNSRLFCEVFLVCNDQPVHVALFERATAEVP
jgi:chemotaxis protein CheX